MGKKEFLEQLCNGLSGLPQGEVEGRLHFYSEMIEDQMEDGLSEEEAVSAIGTADKIIAQIRADISPGKIPKERIQAKRRLKTWEIVLLALGSPIWLSLGISAVAVIFSLYSVWWSVIISLWAVFVSLIGCALGGMAAGTVLACKGNVLTGVAMIAAGCICAGLSVFMFYGCRAATKGTLILTKNFAGWLKNSILKKEEAV